MHTKIQILPPICQYYNTQEIGISIISQRHANRQEHLTLKIYHDETTPTLHAERPPTSPHPPDADRWCPVQCIARQPSLEGPQHVTVKPPQAMNPYRHLM